MAAHAVTSDLPAGRLEFAELFELRWVVSRRRDPITNDGHQRRIAELLEHREGRPVDRRSSVIEGEQYVTGLGGGVRLLGDDRGTRAHSLPRRRGDRRSDADHPGGRAEESASCRACVRHRVLF
jgi:hypothetical protein